MEHLKREAAPRLATRNKKGRGWQQLFDILGEARGYNYLKSIGCTYARFIPRSDRSAPDLEGSRHSDRVLCEVKTINISNDEIAVRAGAPRTQLRPTALTAEFLKKLRSTVEKAEQQMLDYDSSGRAVHFVYSNILFDDFLAERKETYFQQIDEYLTDLPIAGVRLVICNDHTAFYRPLQMRSADVDNVG